MPELKTHYVGRAGQKIAYAQQKFQVDFKDKLVLDVGCSTGGFSQFALSQGARMVFGVEKGTNQLSPKLKDNKQIILYEKTDIRCFKTTDIFDIIMVDLSFISITQVINKLADLASRQTLIILLIKPQFEISSLDQLNRGIVKNENIRRTILKTCEVYLKQYFYIKMRFDSILSGKKGNIERFYLLQKLA